MQRFELEINFWDDEALLRCRNCGWHIFVSGDGVPLAELVQRDGEHTEVCQ
jgi:hypothetical protein